MSKSSKLDPKRINKAVGQYLKDERLKAGLTQEEIADGLDVTNQFICNIENGAASAPFNVIRHVMDECQIPPADVLDAISDIHIKELARSLGIKK